MANKVTLDFENGMITWDTDTQQGTEHCPDLAEREQAILEAMGYAIWDMTPMVDAVNAFLNGQATEKGLSEQLESMKE